MKPKKHLRIRIDDDLIQKIDLEAKKRGISRTSFTKALIEIGLSYYSLNDNKDLLVNLIKKAMEE